MFDAYRDGIRAHAAAAAKPHGYYTLLAKALKCHRSVVPQVLAGKVNLTLDQAADLARFWQLDEGQAAYFLDLVGRERAGSPHLRRLLDRRIEQAQRKARESTTRQDDATEMASLRSQMTYYSHWSYAAAHVLLGIPDLRGPEALARRLRLPVERLLEVISELEAMGLVRRVDGGFEPTERRLHLTKSAAMFPAYCTNWRLRGIEALPARAEGGIAYTGVHALSREARTAVRELLLRSLREAHAMIAPSPEEAGICINVDLFDV